MQLGDTQCRLGAKSNGLWKGFTDAVLPRKVKLNCSAFMKTYNLMFFFFFALFAVYVIFENTFCIN